MKIKINKLLRMIKTVFGVIKNKKAHIISNLILIKNIKEKTFCVAINEEIETVSYDINDGYNENINILIKYDIIYNICKNHNDDSLLEIKKIKNIITIRVEESFFSIPCLNDLIFPSFIHEKKFKTKIKINSLELIELLKINILSLNENNSKIFLNGASMEINKNSLCITSSDGIRISFSQMFLNDINKKIKIIIPKNTLIEIINNFQTEEYINILISENQVQFINKKITLTSRLIDDIYLLPYLNLINLKLIELKIDIKIFKNALNKISFLCTNNSKIYIEIKNNAIHFNVKNNNENAYTNFTYNNDYNIKFNIDYKLLIDIIKIIKSEKFKLIIPNDNKYLIIKEEKLSYLYLIPQLN